MPEFSMVKSVILAGGEGIRLRNVIKDVPKPMATVAGKPFLEYLILQLKKYNIRDVVISIGYKGDAIKSYFGNGEKWDMNISYSLEDEPLGTGGALKKAINMVDDEQFIVMNGDSYLDIDLTEFLDFHIEKHADTTLSLAHSSDTSRYGRVEINKEGKVHRFIEKGVSGYGYINGGIYLFQQDIVDIIPDGNISLEDMILPIIIEKGLFGMTVNGFFIDIGIPEDYLMICNESEKLLNTLPHNSQQVDKLALKLTCDRK